MPIAKGAEPGGAPAEPKPQAAATG
jgi:hypothetical protein